MQAPDGWLLAIVLTLVVFGTVMIFSASFPQTADLAGSARYEPLIRQVMYMLIGLSGMFIAMQIDYHRYARWAFPAMLAIMLLLLALIVVPGLGTTTYGAKSWIYIGSISFQPSELAKPVLIMYMATWLTGKRERVRSFVYGVAQFGVLMGVLVWLLMLEPDLGTSALLVTIGAAMFFVSGAQVIQFVGTMLAGGAVFMALALSASYRRDRLLVFLNPDGDLRNLGWQLFQARLALGSGGLLGLGLGASRQKFSWLPAAHHDAIFAVIGEELGLVGCSLVLLLFVAFAWRGYAIARNARDSLGYLVAVGITTWIVFQAAFNIGGVTVAVPFTGIPLPFVSAGGTALIVTLTSVGVLLNVSRQASLPSSTQTAATTVSGATATTSKPPRPKPRRATTRRPATTAGQTQAPAGKSSRAVRSRVGTGAAADAVAPARSTAARPRRQPARAASTRTAGSNDWNDHDHSSFTGVTASTRRSRQR